MANYKATGKKVKNGPEIVQRVRTAILGAFETVEKEGRLISQILADEFKKDPMRFMDMASKYCPKDVDMRVERVTTAADLTEQELDELIAAARAAGREEGEAPSAPVSPELH